MPPRENLPSTTSSSWPCRPTSPPTSWRACRPSSSCRPSWAPRMISTEDEVQNLDTTTREIKMEVEEVGPAARGEGSKRGGGRLYYEEARAEQDREFGGPKQVAIPQSQSSANPSIHPAPIRPALGLPWCVRCLLWCARRRREGGRGRVGERCLARERGVCSFTLP